MHRYIVCRHVRQTTGDALTEQRCTRSALQSGGRSRSGSDVHIGVMSLRGERRASGKAAPTVPGHENLQTDRSSASARRHSKYTLNRSTFGFGHKVLVEIRLRPNMCVSRPNVSPNVSEMHSRPERCLDRSQVKITLLTRLNAFTRSCLFNAINRRSCTVP